MEVIEIYEKDIWNNFIFFHTKKTESEFLQSWEWGMFQKKLGRKVWFLAIKNKEQIIGQALIIKHSLPFGKSYFYCPRGPIFLSLGKEIFKELVKKIKDLAKKEKAIFFRWDPKDDKFNLKDFNKKKDLQPSKIIILDLKKQETELLKEMHAKTRYNIRLAQKHGVKVFKSNEEKYLNIFLDLLHQTAKREKFKIYPDNYYKKLLNFDPKFAVLYLAEYQNRILAAHLLIFFNHTATYLHGASLREHKEVMAPYLLHWQTIQQAKKENIYFYDFWGIDKNKWPGITRFKVNFKGQEFSYPGTFELPLSKFWYTLYKLSKLCFRLF